MKTPFYISEDPFESWINRRDNIEYIDDQKGDTGFKPGWFNVIRNDFNSEFMMLLM
jgi:hypothetical protein